MVQLRVINGRQAGVETLARQFPFQIGRAAAAQLRLDDPGVWDAHCQILLDPAQGFSLQTAPEAPARLNGEQTRSAPLRNGDLIELGSVGVRFWIAPARPRDYRLREAAVWLGLAALVATELFLMYRLAV